MPQPIRNDTTLIKEINTGLDYLYNFNFDNAYRIYDILKEKRPDHPATYFYYGLYIYWREFPLRPSSKYHNEFVNAMNRSIEAAQSILENDENDVEGVFFDLVPKALQMMYYSDNGMSGKVIKLAPSAYKGVLKSFDLNSIFTDLYFISGLYSYYIEAYPEKKPVYKPITFLFKDGDKKEGIHHLLIAKDSSVFLKNEASIFLAIIYYDFEDNPEMAIKITKELVDKYPDNPYYLGQYAEYLAYNKNYKLTQSIIKKMTSKYRNNSFVVMKAIILKALIEEKVKKDLKSAARNYKTGIKIAESYGSLGENFLSIAYYGLSRIENYNGNFKISKEYFKTAKSYSTDKHFIE